jgi:V/A-type H+-transporting ATPase subunit F
VEYLFIGEAELATAFRFVGVPAFAVTTVEQSQAAFRRVTRGWVEEAGITLPGAASTGIDGWDAAAVSACRVLILTEEVADSLGDELSEWQLSGKYPLVVEVPGLMGKLAGRKTLVEAIRDAIGVRV